MVLVTTCQNEAYIASDNRQTAAACGGLLDICRLYHHLRFRNGEVPYTFMPPIFYPYARFKYEQRFWSKYLVKQRSWSSCSSLLFCYLFLGNVRRFRPDHEKATKTGQCFCADLRRANRPASELPTKVHWSRRYFVEVEKQKMRELSSLWGDFLGGRECKAFFSLYSAGEILYSSSSFVRIFKTKST